MMIIERSKEAADHGERWRQQDHIQLVETLRRIEDLAIKLCDHIAGSVDAKRPGA